MAKADLAEKRAQKASKKVKKDKTMYQICREALGLSREKASEVLECISPETIERIESGKKTATPEEVLFMSDAYKEPSLCNYYCSHYCAIGKQYVPEVKVGDLAAIVLTMVNSINKLDREQERLIEITEDGRISNDELEDFLTIQKELEKLSISVETLQLWIEEKIDKGAIDQEKYDKYMEGLEQSK